MTAKQKKQSVDLEAGEFIRIAETLEQSATILDVHRVVGYSRVEYVLKGVSAQILPREDTEDLAVLVASIAPETAELADRVDVPFVLLMYFHELGFLDFELTQQSSSSLHVPLDEIQDGLRVVLDDVLSLRGLLDVLLLCNSFRVLHDGSLAVRRIHLVLKDHFPLEFLRGSEFEWRMCRFLLRFPILFLHEVALVRA